MPVDWNYRPPRPLPAHQQTLVALLLRLVEAREACEELLGHALAFADPEQVRLDAEALLYQLEAFEGALEPHAGRALGVARAYCGSASAKAFQLIHAGRPVPAGLRREAEREVGPLLPAPQ